jgi:poly(hydroxyalkanoate) depolymerase family esterase
MKINLPEGMRQAIHLTRAGQLDEATRVLKQFCGTALGTQPNMAAPDLTPHSRRSWVLAPALGMATTPSSAATMDKLGGILGRLSPGVQGASAVPTPAAGAEFRSVSFAGATGNRTYKLYVPSGYHGQKVPLIVMLHGCTQSPDDFAAGTGMNALAEQHTCLVAYPAQIASANAQKCWNWFSPADQQRDAGEPALLAGMTRAIMRDYAVDADRVYIAGLSAGGAAAAIMGQAYPELYAAIGVHSGLASGAARDMPSAFAAMRQGAAVSQPAKPGRVMPPAIVFHADRDSTVHPRNGDQVIAQFGAGNASRVEMQDGQVPGGHAYRRSLHIGKDDKTLLEQWLVLGGGHAWSGGQPAGSYTDAKGPDASREMLRFFLEHPRNSTSR